MKIVYICHEFGGKKKNVKRVAKIIKGLIKKHPDICFVSPIHTFGFYYKDVDYMQGIKHCLALLKLANEMWTFGEQSNSRGCMIEKQFCRMYDIQIVEVNL